MKRFLYYCITTPERTIQWRRQRSKRATSFRGQRVVDLPARSFDLARPGVAPPLGQYARIGPHIARNCSCRQHLQQKSLTVQWRKSETVFKMSTTGLDERWYVATPLMAAAMTTWSSLAVLSRSFISSRSVMCVLYTFSYSISYTL